MEECAKRKNIEKRRYRSKKLSERKELTKPYRLVTMFIDYAELMAEDQQPMSMKDW